MALQKIFGLLPEVSSPEEKKLGFNLKLKWTLIILAAFFILANIPLYGLSNNALERFKFLAIVLGTDFGSIISLGVGPIVMASIILQLLVGSKILNIDTSNPEGRKFFQGLQKLLVLAFVVFEALVYVLMKGLEAVPGMSGILILQLIIAVSIALFVNIRMGIDFIYVPFLGPVTLGLFSVPLYTAIIVAFANFFNISDGLDGLSCGLLMIALFAFWFLSNTSLDT
ncbi:MAG: preprotein translocase subunit SecY, partial [Nanoarchaeota archaeon]